MTIAKGQPALPLDFNLPQQVTELKGRDGETYLQFTIAHGDLLRADLRRALALLHGASRTRSCIGAKCDKCGNVMVPAATWHCPNCNFAAMHEVELPHKGVLAQTAPITIFPSASFIGDAPLRPRLRGRGDATRQVASFLDGALAHDHGRSSGRASSSRAPRLKLVFEDERQGSIRDMFFVPMSEVPEKLQKKKPLLASDLNFTSPSPRRSRAIRRRPRPRRTRSPR